MRKIFLAVFILSSTLFLSGCFAVLIGAGVAGGIAISEDTAKLEVDASLRRGLGASFKALETLGTVTLRDQEAGKLEASVRESKVWVTITQVTSKTIRIEVRARKNLLPNVDLAMEIVNKINARL